MSWIEKKQVRSGTRYRAYWRDPGGKTHGKVFPRRRDAEAFLRDVGHRIDRGSYIDPKIGRIRLADFYETFQEGAVWSPKTRDTYSWLAKSHILPQLGHRSLNSITRVDVANYLNGLRERGVGDATVNAAYRLLRRLLTVAEEEGRIARNPAVRMRVRGPQRREPRFLTDEEVDRLVSEMPDRFKAMVLFMAYTGLRIGEAVALRVKNVDFLRARVTVVEAATEVGGRRVEGRTKTGRGRAVIMPRIIRDELVAHLERFGNPRDPESLVFTAAQGGPIRQNTFRSRVFTPAAKRAGLEPLPHVHDLRHTAAALAIARGVGAKQIQEQLGHSSIATTLNVYGHLFETLQEDLADRHDEALQRLRESDSRHQGGLRGLRAAPGGGRDL